MQRHRTCRVLFLFGFFIARYTNECAQLIPLRFLETILSHVEILFGAICHGKTGQNLLFITQHNCRAGCITEVEEITEIPIRWRVYSLGQTQRLKADIPFHVICY